MDYFIDDVDSSDNSLNELDMDVDVELNDSSSSVLDFSINGTNYLYFFIRYLI